MSLENTSGQGAAAVVPPEIDRWNWGAFLLNWIWGIGNNTFIAFLMFVPLANMVMPFVLGAKGSIWAWRNKRWESVERFKAAQLKWALWGVAVWVMMIVFAVGMFFFVASLLKNTDAYRLGLARLQASAAAVDALGPPISTGMVQGSIHTTGPSGNADISFSVKGRRAEGTVYLQAHKDMGRWQVERAELEIDGRAGRIDLSR